MKRVLQFSLFIVAIGGCSPAVYSTSTPTAGPTQTGAIEDDIKDPANQAQYPCALPSGGTGVQVCHVPPGGAPVDICAAIPVCTPTGGGDDDSSSDDHSSDDNSSDDHSSGDHNSGDHSSGDHNSGDHSSDDHSSGDHHSRDHHSGDHNSGSCQHSGSTGLTTQAVGAGEICTETGIPADGGQNFLGPCSDVF